MTKTPYHQKLARILQRMMEEGRESKNVMENQDFLMGVQMEGAMNTRDMDQEIRDDITQKLEILLRDFLNSADNVLNVFTHKDFATWH